MEFILKEFSKAGQKDSLFLFTGVGSPGNASFLDYFAVSAENVLRQSKGKTSELFLVLREKNPFSAKFFGRIDGVPAAEAGLGNRRLPLLNTNQAYGYSPLVELAIESRKSAYEQNMSNCDIVSTIVRHQARIEGPIRSTSFAK